MFYLNYLTIFLQGAAGIKGIIWAEVLGQAGEKIGRPTTMFLDHWTPDNPTDKFPRILPTQRQNIPDSYPSSFWVKDASYLRLKNLQVGYTIPAKVLSRIGISRARIYYSGQNLLTLTGYYKQVDPEAPIATRGNYYPQVLTNTVGINITF